MRKVYQLSLILLFFSFSTSLFSHDGIKKGFHFTENKGQHGDNVAFHSKLHVGNMFLEKDRFTFDLFSAQEMNSLFETKHTSREEKNGIPQIQKRQPEIDPSIIEKKFKKHSYSMIFNGSNSNPSIIPNLMLSGAKNYFIGNDKSKWAFEAKSYKSVRYNELYDNIDMEVYSEFEWMKYDFIVHPGGNPNEIQINYEGVDGLSVNSKGELIIELSTGEIKEVKLKAYQDLNGKRVSVPCFFNINGTEISYSLPKGYDTNFDLVIDPIWVFSSLSGSTADNWGFTSTYDTLGNLYSAGIAFGNGYPATVGAYSTTSLGGDFDISITKFDPTGANVLYATYLGGNDNEMPHSLVHDSQNNLVILGSSSSTNYPTPGGYDQTFNGGWTGTSANMWGSPYSNGADIILTRLNSSGNIINSTYIGGSDNEGINESMVYNYADQGRGELVLDANDDVYVATSLWSDDFPGISGGSINNGAGWGAQDAVVFKMNSTLSSLDWARYLGGTDYECGNSIRVSDQGTVFVCGATTSSDLGATGGVYDQTFNGVWDGYIASFNANTGAPIARTYIGTSEYDQTFILEVDDQEDVYVVGQTLGSYPVVNAAYSNANSAQFIHKLNSSLSLTDYSTIFGSGSLTGPPNQQSIDISPTAFLVDHCGNVYVSGWGGGFNSATSFSGVYNPFAGGSTNGLPLTADAQQSSTDGSDFYFFVMERDATGLLYGTYFGDPNVAEHTDGGTSRFDPDGVVYQSVCAACNSPWTFPTTPGVAYPNSGTAGQAFFCNMGSIKFEFDFQGVEATANVPANLTMCTTDYSVDFTSTGTNPQHFWDFGDGSGTSTAANPTYTYATVGIYNVMYVAIDPSSCNISDTAYFSVELIQAPTFNANFNLPNIPPCSDPASVTVNANVSGTGIDSLQWDMGDGTIYTDINSISHSYTSQGIYPIEVIAWDLTCGFSDTIVDTLNFITAVSNAVATAPADTTLCSSPPYNMNFTSDGSTPSVFWDFGDGNTSTLPNPTNAFADSGTYQVMFIAIDPNTCNLEDTAYFTVELLQAATFSAQISVPTIPPCSDPTLIPLNASFTGTGADSLVWDLGDGTIYTDSTNFTYYYSNPGVYTVSMTAWDLTCNNTNTISQVVDFNSTFSTATATVPPDTLLCSSPPFNMDFTSNGSTPDVFWDFGDGNTSTLPNPTNAFADSGTYVVMFIAIDSTTCNIADTAYFTVDLQQAAVFNAQFNVPTIPPCSDPTLIPLNASFTGTGADSLVWDLGDGTIYTDSTSFTYYYASSGIYTVSMTAWDFTCNNTNTVSQVVNFISSFSTATATAPNDTTICSTPPYNMDFTSDGSTPDVFWDFGDGNTSTLPNPTNAFADSGFYQVMFIAIDSTTCNTADTAYFDVEIIQAPTFIASFNLPVIPPCSDPDSVTVNANFSGSGIDSLVWDMGDGTQIFDSTSIAYNYTAEGIYNISVSAWGFCGNDTTISEIFNFNTDSSLAVAYAPEDTLLCTTPPFSIGFNSYGSNPSQLWDFGDGNTSTDPNPNHVFADTGNYVVTYIAIDSSSCNISDTAVFNVTLLQAEQFSAELNFDPPPPCGIDSMLVELAFTGTGADSLIWDMGNGDIFNDSNVNYYYTVPGTYQVALTAYDLECDYVETISEAGVFAGNFNTEDVVPNVFSPNGDGDNDQLRFIRVNDTKEFKITIYNRWGAVIYESTNANVSWDGNSPGGKLATAGVYFFEIRYTDKCSEDEKLETGFIHLVR